jgi:Uma2 family endonuclease
MATQAPLVYEDLESFPDDGLRREILAGELYVTPSPIPRHQKVVLEVARALADYAEQAGGEAYIAPLDTVLSAQNVVEPDVVYVAPDRMHTLGTKAIIGVPSLVVEVLSPGTARIDYGRKRDVYAQFAVPEYWIVDPDANTIERCINPVDAVYRDIVMFDADMPAATLPGLVLLFEKIFR